LGHPAQVVTIHDASVFAVPGSYTFPFRLWYRFLHPRLGRRAAAVLTDSEFSRQELARLASIPSQKVHVVPLGSEHVHDVPPDFTIVERLNLRRPIVLTVGSHNPHKNLGAFVRAAKFLADLDCDFVVAGSVNPRVFQGPRANLAESVRVTGYLSDACLRGLYERAACFVYPSRYEGFGLPPLEAMACGCPVVVSRAASLPEVCGDAALYFAPDDPAEIAECIALVLRDRVLARRLADHGRARAGLFTWDRAASALLQALASAQETLRR
jgi:glycosyltransferase involved in cell wall biosynthesis